MPLPLYEKATMTQQSPASAGESESEPAAHQRPERRTADEPRTEGAVAPTGAGVDTGAGTTRPKTEAELAADRAYEEAIEEEYAKREGGA